MPFNRFSHSILGELRPRFKLKIDVEPEKALAHAAERLRNDKTVSGECSDHILFLKTPSSQRHYWSPEMTVRIEKEEFCDYTTVSCLLGPHQTVWALFTFFYAAIALSTLFGGMFAWVDYNETGATGWMWIIPIGIFLAGSIFTTSKIGQKKGRDQSLHLVSFIYHTLDDIAEVERIPT